MKRFVVFLIVMSSFLGTVKVKAQVSVGVSVGIAPPAIPVYEQPPCPVDGYIWTPGYWAWGPDGYYWVPGVWIDPPEFGFLWTPGYWGCVGGHYYWHNGYWGPHVGFYGGVNYGFGYGGVGYTGGRWDGHVFRYNTAVSRVNTRVIHNTYVDRSVVARNTSRASFNGPGGTSARPTAGEEAAARESHVPATHAQASAAHVASTDRSQLASRNGGHPATLARSSVGGQRYGSAGAIHRAAPASRPAAAPVSHAAPHAARVHTAPVHSAPAMHPVSHPAPAMHSAPMHSAPMHSAPMRGGGGPAGRRR